MTTGINPVQAASSKKTATKRYNHQENAGFAQVLHRYLSGDALAPVSPRQDGFERHKEAPSPQNKVQGFEVKAMQMQVMQVNRELSALFLGVFSY